MSKEKPQLGRSPCFTNGRTTRNSYLVVAVRDDVGSYNAVGVKKLSPYQYKFHFWPSARALGVATLLEGKPTYQREDGGLSTVPYTGVVLSRADTEALLDGLKNLPSMKIAHRQHVMDVLDGGEFDPSQHVTTGPYGDVEDDD